MAVVRPTRSSPPYALIIFIFLWVVATGLAVYFYVHGYQFEQQLTAYREDVPRKIVSDRERQGEAVQTLISQGSKDTRSPRTAMGQALYEIRQLQGRIDGAKGETAAFEVLLDQVDQARKAAGQETTPSLLMALTNVSALAKQEKERADHLTTALAAAADQARQNKTGYDGTNTGYAKTIEERKQEIDKLNADLAKLRADATATVAGYEADKTKLQKDLEDAQRSLVVQLQQAKEDAERLKQQVNTLKGQIELIRPTVSTTMGLEPDGRIVRTQPSTGEIWISLGRADRINLGLTFAVYDARMGVAKDGKGKGALEVVEVGENESLCRITHLEKSAHLDVNDLIANPVYNKDKTRKFHFFVYGEFDLDGDNHATPGEREKLVRLIQTWGGVIDDKLNTQTDFLVLGAMPGAATKTTDSDPNSDLAKQRTSVQKEYQDLLAQAKDFSIPVLNSNRFLSMIGYYNTTLIRY